MCKEKEQITESRSQQSQQRQQMESICKRRVLHVNVNADFYVVSLPNMFHKCAKAKGKTRMLRIKTKTGND